MIDWKYVEWQQQVTDWQHADWQKKVTDWEYVEWQEQNPVPNDLKYQFHPPFG